MGIAMFTASGLIAPLHALAGWLVTDFVGMRPRRALGGITQQGRPAATPVAVATTASARPCRVVRPAASLDRTICSGMATPAMRRPLRVVRVMEAGQPAGAERLRISGRMADVCAELDRLAAREAAQQLAASH